jgi:hypothetical protein
MRAITLILFVSFFILPLLKSFAQDEVTEIWATEQFGERFISAKEAGFGNLNIPFTKSDLKYDRISWLIPIEIDGVPQYRMIQARYSPNESEKNDTLSLQDAEKVISVVNKTRRNFPNKEPFKFFRTKDLSFIDGTVYRRTIVCDTLSYSVINLPANISVVMKGKNSTSYISNVNGGIEISLDFSEESRKEETKGYSVMTIVSLTPSK